MLILILSIAIVFCVLCAVIVFLFTADVLYWFRARKIRKIEKTIVNRNVNVNDFLSCLLNASIKLIQKGKKISYPALRGDTVLKRAKFFWFESKKNVIDGGGENYFHFDWAENGWIVYAIEECGKNGEFVTNLFDEKIVSLPLRMVNHAQLGMVALLLYAKTKDKKYRDYAETIYSFLINQDTEYGILYRPKLGYDLVDVIGMVIPFLSRYAELFSDEKARLVAEKTISAYIKYGCDKDTGIPASTFLLSQPHIKGGVANWGRGCAWFLIGLMYIETSRLGCEEQAVVNKLETTLLNLWNSDNTFGQFIGEWGRDLSAELPIVYYLYERKLIDIDKEVLLNYSSMCHDGIMYNCSSENHGIIKYGTPVGPFALAQAFMMRLIQLYKERNPQSAM